jgi:hypothetical protein
MDRGAPGTSDFIFPRKSPVILRSGQVAFVAGFARFSPSSLAWG